MNRCSRIQRPNKKNILDSGSDSMRISKRNRPFVWVTCMPRSAPAPPISRLGKTNSLHKRIGGIPAAVIHQGPTTIIVEFSPKSICILLGLITIGPFPFFWIELSSSTGQNEEWSILDPPTHQVYCCMRQTPRL